MNTTCSRSIYQCQQGSLTFVIVRQNYGCKPAMILKYLGNMTACKSVHQCDICSENGDSVAAIWYCEDCDNYLCDNCFNYHKKHKLSRYHIFRMQDTGDRICRRENEITGEECKVHDNGFVEFYCEDHNHVMYLTELNQDERCSSQANDCRTALRELDQDTEALESEVRQNEAKMQVTSMECLNKMEQFRHEINETVDTLQTQLAYEVKKKRTDNSRMLKSVLGSCEVVRGKIKQRISEIERYEEIGHACRMYVALKGLNEDIVSIRNDLRQTRAINHVKLYTFIPDRQLQSYIFEAVERFGKMEEILNSSEEVCGTETKNIKILTKEEIIDDLQQQLREKTQLVDKYQQQLREKTKLADKYQQQLKEKTQLADKYQQQLTEKTQLADKYQQQLTEKTKLADKYQQQLREKTQLADKYQQQLTEKTKLADKYQQQLTEKTKLADKYEQHTKEKTTVSKKYEQQLREKAKLADEYKQEVKDVTLTMEKRIKEREKMVDDLRQQLREKTELLEGTQHELKELKEQEKIDTHVEEEETVVEYVQELSLPRRSRQPGMKTCTKCGERVLLRDIVTGDVCLSCVFMNQ